MHPAPAARSRTTVSAAPDIGTLAVRCLLVEVDTFPKPGLVSRAE